jgi:hypothetical protein
MVTLLCRFPNRGPADSQIEVRDRGIDRILGGIDGGGGNCIGRHALMEPGTNPTDESSAVFLIRVKRKRVETRN